MQSSSVRVRNEVKTLLGWPCSAFSIDHFNPDHDGKERCGPAQESDAAIPTRSDSLEEAKHDIPRNSDDVIMPHTIIIFIPGNPGIADWYIPLFEKLVERLGPGYSARGISNAGHSVNTSEIKAEYEANTERKGGEGGNKARAPLRRDTSICRTVDGQTLHKIAYIDSILDDFDKRNISTSNNGPDSGHTFFAEDPARKDEQIEGKEKSSSTVQRQPHFILISHSIGSHFTQRLCIARHDLLKRTRLILHLMPFIRAKAIPEWKQSVLDLVASNSNGKYVKGVGQMCMAVLSSIPVHLVDQLCKNTMTDSRARKIAVELMRQPAFAANFLSLGCEEIRDVPEVFDACSLRVLSQQCPIRCLYTKDDHWAPLSHMFELNEFEDRMDALCSSTLTRDDSSPPPTSSSQQQSRRAARNIICTAMLEARHDFVGDNTQVDSIVDFCEREISKREALKDVSRIDRQENRTSEYSIAKVQSMRSRL